MKTIRILLSLTPFIVVSSVLLFNSCGSSRDNDPANDNPGYATLALFVTDRDPSVRFEQALATIERVELVNTGTGEACDVLGVPTTLDMADLGAVAQLVGMGDCPAGAYDGIRVEIDKSAQLTSAASGTGSPSTSLCSFASYLDETNAAHALQCSGPICMLDMDFPVHAPANRKSRLALGLTLPGSGVTSLDDPLACSLTVAVAPLFLRNPGMTGRPEAVTGLVSELTVTSRTFTLVRGASLFTVDYSGATEQQPGLDHLLRFAETNSLRVKVVSPGIDLAGETISASDVFVKVAGVSPNMNMPDQPLLLTFPDAVSDADIAAIAIDYAAAETVGLPAENGWVIARLYGHDGTNFLASRIMVEPSGMSGDG